MEAFIGVLLGGGILTFLQFLITRHDNKKDELKSIKKSIDELSKRIAALDAKGDEREATHSRVRILRFEDELLFEPEKKHSKDSFEQVLSDITAYTNYCASHQEYKNHQTAASIEHIMSVYNERLEKHDWAS